jgi:hypothetical protein
MLSALLVGGSLISAAHAVHLQEEGDANVSPVHKHKMWLPTSKVSNAFRESDEEKICVLDPAPASQMGYKGEDWQAVSFEIEMYPLEDNEPLRKPGMGPKEVLKAGMDLFEDKVLKSVERDPPDSCDDRLFKVKEEDDEQSWMFELEKHEIDRPYMMEASSPQEMGENETEIAITQTGLFDKYFSKHPSPTLRGDNSWEVKGDNGIPDPPGLHVHVMSKCMLKDVRRLVATLLIWERFDDAIYERTGMTLHKGEAGLKAKPVADKSPAVFKHLRSYITKDGWKEPDADEPLGDVFTDHGSRKEMNGDKENADGWRRLEVNICHLLHVKCAHDLPEKEAPAVPKFGALEFRGFDPNIGEPLRLIVSLVQKLVQFGCSAPLDGGGKLHTLAFGGEGKDSDTVDNLFNVLEINTKDFQKKTFTEAKFADKYD